MDNFSNTPQQPSANPTKKPSLFRRVVDDLKYYVDYARNSNEYSTFGKAGEQCIYRTLIEDLHIPNHKFFVTYICATQKDEAAKLIWL